MFRIMDSYSYIVAKDPLGDHQERLNANSAEMAAEGRQIYSAHPPVRENIGRLIAGSPKQFVRGSAHVVNAQRRSPACGARLKREAHIFQPRTRREIYRSNSPCTIVNRFRISSWPSVIHGVLSRARARFSPPY